MGISPPARPIEVNKPILVRKFSLVFKHLFSFEFIYKRLHEWLVEEGYCTPGGGAMNGENWIEDLYLERIDARGGKQIWVWWRLDKEHNNPFFKFYLEVEFHGLNMFSEKIVVKGTKVKMDKGEVEVFVTAKMEVDPKGEWNDNFILKNKWLQRFYLNRIYKDQIEQAEGELVKDCARFLGAVKQYFQMESWLPEYAGEPFHPAKGE